MSNLNIIDFAIEMAASAHINQKRKGTDTPYIVHPFSVGLILSNAGCSDELITAGILHDVIEDADISIQHIREKFGNIVADIVNGCSEPDHDKKLWKERKEHTIQSLKTAPYDIRLVSCADKLHNIRSIKKDYNEHGDSVWQRFNAGEEDQKWYYTSLALQFSKHNDSENSSLFETFEKEVREFFKD